MVKTVLKEAVCIQIKNRSKEVGIIGSRSLGYEYAGQVADVVNYLVNKGYAISSGGAIGADQFCIEALLQSGHANQAQVYAPWKSCEGFPAKIRAMMQQYKQYGGKIIWGPIPSYKKVHPGIVKLALLNRNIKLARACYGVVSFIDAASRGTIFTIKAVAQKRKKLVVFPFDCALPQIKNVKWVPLNCTGCWQKGFKAVYF